MTVAWNAEWYCGECGSSGQERVQSGSRCTNKVGGLAAEEQPFLFGRRDADERARDAWRDEYGGPALDW
ncbi:hypothetical protein Kpho02_68040 [Kitasatospora phosalacinea]|uniref:Uncharacterized protein n=1 Tax=Kitasatospora phosalacinea TaxID=2065 RepID=A0A9W6V497_9ACTN|nr:hypothetical protein [Kitasatospora phosalacinea]GLW74506.1 hypothetical protein Kpho02_68040 [Kitasatospora phosalacinea]